MGKIAGLASCLHTEDTPIAKKIVHFIQIITGVAAFLGDASPLLYSDHCHCVSHTYCQENIFQELSLCVSHLLPEDVETLG